MSTKISIDEDANEPIQKGLMDRVLVTFQEEGYNVPRADDFEVPEHRDHRAAGKGIIPEFMVGNRDLAYELTTGEFFLFQPEEQFDDHFGEPVGSSPVTVAVVEFQKTLEETTRDLIRSGQIDIAINKVERFVEPMDVSANPTEMVAYMLATFGKGWAVEKALAQTDRFSKGNAAQDSGGLDLYDRKLECWIQVKCVTFYAGANTTDLEEDDRQFLWYQWTDGGLQVGTDANQVNSDAVPRGTSATLAKKTDSSRYTIDGRPFRYLWW